MKKQLKSMIEKKKEKRKSLISLLANIQLIEIQILFNRSK